MCNYVVKCAGIFSQSDYHGSSSSNSTGSTIHDHHCRRRITGYATQNRSDSIIHIFCSLDSLFSIIILSFASRTPDNREAAKVYAVRSTTSSMKWCKNAKWKMDRVHCGSGTKDSKKKKTKTEQKCFARVDAHDSPILDVQHSHGFQIVWNRLHSAGLFASCIHVGCLSRKLFFPKIEIVEQGDPGMVTEKTMATLRMFAVLTINRLTNFHEMILRKYRYFGIGSRGFHQKGVRYSPLQTIANRSAFPHANLIV